MGNHYVKIKNNNIKIKCLKKSKHLSKDFTLEKLDHYMPAQIKKRIQNKKILFKLLWCFIYYLLYEKYRNLWIHWMDSILYNIFCLHSMGLFARISIWSKKWLNDKKVIGNTLFSAKILGISHTKFICCNNIHSHNWICCIKLLFLSQFWFLQQYWRWE